MATSAAAYSTVEEEAKQNRQQASRIFESCSVQDMVRARHLFLAWEYYVKIQKCKRKVSQDKKREETFLEMNQASENKPI